MHYFRYYLINGALNCLVISLIKKEMRPGGGSCFVLVILRLSSITQRHQGKKAEQEEAWPQQASYSRKPLLIFACNSLTPPRDTGSAGGKGRENYHILLLLRWSNLKNTFTPSGSRSRGPSNCRQTMLTKVIPQTL